MELTTTPRTLPASTSNPLAHATFTERPALAVLSHQLVVKAKLSCERDFEGVYRKAPKGAGLPPDPYSVHPHAVALRLAEAGYDADVVAAGYLHDHLEDLPHLWTKERLAKEFTPRIAELVDWVSEQNKSLPWAERKAAYLERLSHAPEEAIAISVADKTSNLSDMNATLRMGFPVETFLKAGWEANSKKVHRLMPIYARVSSPRLLSNFTVELLTFDELGPKVGKVM